ncbi:MAG: phosphoesterase, partial [Thermoguttaceae bacterium]
MIEQVLVVPRSKFEQIGYFQGFCKDVAAYRNVLLLPENVSFLSRDKAETDPSFKQLIPYLIFSHTDQQGKVYVFRYVRGKGQSEGRLHHKHSIGIGGHISSIDSQDDANSENTKLDLYNEGLRRELHEEVVIDSPYAESCVGLINDDETEVGKVHLGVVHRFELAEPKLRP